MKPELLWEATVTEECSSGRAQCAPGTLSNTILLWCVWSRVQEANLVCCTPLLKALIFVDSLIVTAKCPEVTYVGLIVLDGLEDGGLGVDAIHLSQARGFVEDAQDHGYPRCEPDASRRDGT